jgi:hypothetical protein
MHDFAKCENNKKIEQKGENKIISIQIVKFLGKMGKSTNKSRRTSYQSQTRLQRYTKVLKGCSKTN